MIMNQLLDRISLFNEIKKMIGKRMSVFERYFQCPCTVLFIKHHCLFFCFINQT
jgi:hypothetical protein